MLGHWRTRLDQGGQLTKVGGRPATWDAGAVLAAGDAHAWEARVAFDPSATPSFVLGIVDLDAAGAITEAEDDLAARVLRSSPQGRFVEVLSTAGYPRLWSSASGKVKPSFIDGFGAVASGLSLRYEDGEATFLSGYKRFGPHKMPPGNYRPCVLLCSLNASVQVAFLRKRRRMADAGEPEPSKGRRLSLASEPRYAGAGGDAPPPYASAELLGGGVLREDSFKKEELFAQGVDPPGRGRGSGGDALPPYASTELLGSGVLREDSSKKEELFAQGVDPPGRGRSPRPAPG